MVCLKMEEILQAAQRGHSFFIFGQAGTGKTYTLLKIIDAIKKHKTLLVSASTGIAATSLGGKTVHSLFGLRDGRFTSVELIHKIDNDADFNQIKDNITHTDVLIIDEISMLSRVTFLQLEEVIRTVRGRLEPFGGMQIIAAGDLYQLKPVPNHVNSDPGELVIVDDFIKKTIPHHFILQKVYRQTEDDLVAAIHQLSRGIECSQETIKLMTELKRPLPQNSRPIKLFANNYDVDKCNSDNLMRMKGKMKVYKSVNSGDMQAIKGCVAPDKLFLKVGAPVTLLANIADNLVNGLRGTVKELWEDHVVVKFNGITRETDIHPYNFSIFNPNLGKNIANRKQLPIKLAFALTVHKAQGMTLEEVEVDCRKMTAPGQIGVAIGRAKTKSGLRVLNFYPGQMVRQPQLIEEFYNSSSAPLQDGCFCCTRLQIKPDSRQPSASEVHHANHTQQILHADEAVENDETSIEFLDFFEEAIVLAQGLTLPKNVNPDHYLSDMYFENTYTDEQKLVNDMVPFLKARPVITGTFFKLIYHQMVVLFNECISNENPTGSSFTEFYSKVHKLVGSKLYTDYVKLLFTTSSLSSIHYRIAFGILEKLRGQVVASAALGAKESAVRYVSMIGSKTFKSSPGGDGTIRYIGGWCLGSLRNSKQKRVISNLYDDTNQSVVEKCHNDVLMLDSLMCTEAEARETAEDPLTLNQIERKDSLKGSLCHIHEKTFAFFKTLDKFIRKHETVEHLAIHGKDLYDVIFKNISEDESLTNTWEALFEIKDDASLQKRRASNLLGDVVKKYLKMSAGQFRKEYLRVLKIKKSEAHRKQIKITDSKSVQNTSTHKLSESSKAPTKRGKRTISKEKRKGKGKVKKSTIVQWPCGGCHNECLMDCVCCDSCDIWFHYQCLGLYGDEAELEEEEWFCPQCKSKKAD